MSSHEPNGSENGSQTTIDQYKNTTAADTATDTRETADNSDTGADTNPEPQPKISEVN